MSTLPMIARVIVGATVTLRASFSRAGATVTPVAPTFTLRLRDTDTVLTPDATLSGDVWEATVTFAAAGTWGVRVEADGAVGEAVIDVNESWVVP